MNTEIEREVFQMYKYEMIIDGENYNALFTDHFEADEFLTECDQYYQQVVVKGYHEVTSAEIMADPDFEYAYKIEMVAEMCLPNAHDFKKWYQQEAELKRLGFIA